MGISVEFAHGARGNCPPWPVDGLPPRERTLAKPEETETRIAVYGESPWRRAVVFRCEHDIAGLEVTSDFRPKVGSLLTIQKIGSLLSLQIIKVDRLTFNFQLST